MEVRTKAFHKGRANTSLSLHLVHDGDSGSQEKWAHEKVSACVTTFKSSAEPHHHYQPPSTILFEQETMFVGCVFLQCKHMLSSICCLIEAVSFPVPPANQPAFLCSPALGGGGEWEKGLPLPKPWTRYTQADTQMDNGLAVHCYTNTTPAVLLSLPGLYAHSCLHNVKQRRWDQIIRINRLRI